MAKKKTSVKKSAKTRKQARRNDSLRRKLEGLLRTIEKAHRSTQAFAEIRKVRQALPLAIQKLKDNPGPAQNPGDSDIGD